MPENKEGQEPREAPEGQEPEVREAPEQEIRHFGGSVRKRTEDGKEVSSSYVGPGEELLGEEEEEELREAGKRESAPKPTQLPAEPARGAPTSPERGSSQPPQATQVPAPSERRTATPPAPKPGETPEQGRP